MTNFQKIISGGVLILASIFLVLSGSGKNPTTKAQSNAPLTYQTTWKATQLLSASAPIVESGDFAANPMNAVIGVTGWKVKGTSINLGSNTPLFDEDWRVGGLATDFTNTQFIFHGGEKTNGFNVPLNIKYPYFEILDSKSSRYTLADLNTDWLYYAGTANNQKVRFTFSNIDPDTPQSTGAFPRKTPPNLQRGQATYSNGWSAFGDGPVNCTPIYSVLVLVDANCVAATGSYGFQFLNITNNGVNPSNTAYGVMIPMKWTVTGTIN